MTDPKEYKSVSTKDDDANNKGLGSTIDQFDEGDGIKLKPTLGLIQGCTVIVGSIIGSGIFISPGGVLLGTGSINLALVIWAASGIFSMIGAYCYAELGCMIRKSGGDYTYILDTFGPFIGFIRLWAECVIVRPCTITIVALTFATYAAKPFFPNCDPPDASVRLLAAACICSLTFINCWEVKWATFVQDIFTYAKVLALIIIVITGFVQLGRGNVEYFTWDNTESDVTKIALSFYSGLFAYNGWNYLNFVIEELQDPVRNLPRAIAISFPEVLGSEAVAVTFAGVNGILLTSSRLFYAGAVENQMPEILSMIQVSKMTPAPAVLIVVRDTIFFLLLIYYFIQKYKTNIYLNPFFHGQESMNEKHLLNLLINYTGFATWVSIGLAVFCLPYLRYKYPDWERPIKVNLFFPIIYIIATIFITVVPMIASPVETGIGIAQSHSISFSSTNKAHSEVTYRCTSAIQKEINATKVI
ncbi:Large neutral amino acids transporter small subunit 1,Putative L-type amino acid transporter 1-like protein IMAA,Putative L-type amino acid transporter 1-like protein MLAS,Y+L amino acid transporter 2,Large neutral amino acids transporter small subunit 2,Y+L amino acid transporter 1 [Lepeophtheirus salmonis]|uniref:Y+L amino acid transporter 2like [Apis florea] n=1 Tax=Lepeophtheirus salmonis TaxID=72036 RepID=A0A7R8H569_LEPSM|nr:Large neutral amino acids transporter small subunit 1,Putative L-type amino acid transporter 1-like protein IMAA,Putative L-type amino acid transporter 1-like protein MLAS,Y+L amino acid transporter 2,Large neutral amino acids transporter small subunit 2,Y+L amino acid transporter 1 [Lepeophtheirus salmonis]CAF2871250.1 Large neutral amino acids transporter small subunit 1,Putative L-type amino acid transporter 1-like protein IMAA,Putative L-type amino acid transporter 1-like protein MLAS,Y+L a